MGCLFSSSAAPEPKERKRVPIPETPSAPINNLDAVTPNMALPSGKSTSKIGGLKVGTPAVYGTSVTDRHTLEQDNYSFIVSQAKDAFIDVNIQSRVQVTALSPTAQARAAKFENMLSTVQVPNMPNGFFEAQVPQTALTAAPQDIASILAPIDYQAAELSAACAAESCLALSDACVPIMNEALVISIAAFEQA